jgi:hypothetical protein
MVRDGLGLMFILFTVLGLAKKYDLKLFECLFSWSIIVPSILRVEVGYQCKKRCLSYAAHTFMNCNFTWNQDHLRFM